MFSVFQRQNRLRNWNLDVRAWENQSLNWIRSSTTYQFTGLSKKIVGLTLNSWPFNFHIRIWHLIIKFMMDWYCLLRFSWTGEMVLSGKGSYYCLLFCGASFWEPLHATILLLKQYWWENGEDEADDVMIWLELHQCHGHDTPWLRYWLITSAMMSLMGLFVSFTFSKILIQDKAQLTAPSFLSN